MGKAKEVKKEVNIDVEDPDLEAPWTLEIAHEEEVLGMLENENRSSQSNVSVAEGIDPVNTKSEPDQPLDEELPLELSIRPPPKPVAKSRRS